MPRDLPALSRFLVLVAGLLHLVDAASIGDRLNANFFFQAGMPLTRDEAVAAGWTEVSNSAEAGNISTSNCNNLFGIRYRKLPALAPTMLFDALGQLAGMQWGVDSRVYPTYPCSSVGPPFWQETEPNIMSTTVYFSDPEGLCSTNGRPKLPSGSVGDRVWVRNSIKGNGPENFYSVPLTRAGADGEKLKADDWVAGGCLTSNSFIKTLKQGMGNHYWRHASKTQDVMTVFPYFLLYDQTDRLLMIGFEAIAPTNVFPTSDGKKPRGCPLGAAGIACPTSTFRCQTNPLFPFWPNGKLPIQCGKYAPSVDLWEYPVQPLILEFFQSPMMPGQIVGLESPDHVCGSYSAVTMHVAFRDANSVTEEACRVNYSDPINAKIKAAGRNTTKALQIISDSYNLEGLVRNCSAVVQRCSKK